MPLKKSCQSCSQKQIKVEKPSLLRVISTKQMAIKRVSKKKKEVRKVTEQENKHSPLRTKRVISSSAFVDVVAR